MEISEVQKWTDHISSYQKEFKKWERRSEKIIKRYRDEGRQGQAGYCESRFNILWSNVQTLTASTFAQLPKPDVSRRFKDQDPVGRVAALILERALEYEVNKYTDYDAAIRCSINDRFLGGRGTSWVRYEPHFRAAQESLPQDGDQISEDVDLPNEELDYECAPCDYVHWRDFGHTVARTWEEVTAVWRVVYLTREQCVERFGPDGEDIPLDSKPDDWKSRNSENSVDEYKSRAKVYEIWNKQTKEAIWISETLKKVLDRKPDPLGLEEFFPCPRPLYATITNDSLIPIPDFSLYQDQANELDILSDRIDGLVKGLKIMGVYDSSCGDLQRLFTESVNTTLIPVSDWTAFSEKSGLKGSMDIVDLTPLAAALREAYLAFDQIKGQIYEITGISDIIRGATQASETATAQQLKGQYASLRLKTYQREVAHFATDMLQIKAQIMCGKFAPQTLLAISAADQLSESDKQLIPQALELLIGRERMMNPDAPEGPNPMRSFRIEIDADTLVYMDEQAEKQSRMEFLGAVSGFMDKAVPAAQQSPEMAPLLLEMLRFGVRGFKVGKTLEGSFDSAADQMKQAAMNPKPPQPNPDMLRLQADQQSEQMRLQKDVQADQAKLQFEGQKLQIEDAGKQRELQMKQQFDQYALQMTQAFEKWKAELDAQTRLDIAQITSQAPLMQAQNAASMAAVEGQKIDEITNNLSKGLEDLAKGQQELHLNHETLVKQVSVPKAKVFKHVRGKDGKIEHTIMGDESIVKPVPQEKRFKHVRGPDGKITETVLIQ